MITEYNKPSMDFYEFAVEDIITVSGDAVNGDENVSSSTGGTEL